MISAQKMDRTAISLRFRRNYTRRCTCWSVHVPCGSGIGNRFTASARMYSHRQTPAENLRSQFYYAKDHSNGSIISLCYIYATFFDYNLGLISPDISTPSRRFPDPRFLVWLRPRCRHRPFRSSRLNRGQIWRRL